MKSSRRAKRRQRHYSRMHRAGGLNLVSLMDIFTILVFFLMVNSSDVKVLQNTADVPLPSSSAEHQAQDTLTVLVTREAILVDGREVAQWHDVGADAATIDGLANELRYRRSRHQSVPDAGLEVTILAGRETEYALLRKIMQTCVDEDYRQVRLAVESKQRVESGGRDMADQQPGSSGLPWSRERGERIRFGLILSLMLLVFMVPALWIPAQKLAEPERSETEQVPPQLARLMERRTPPEPVVPEPEPELDAPEPEPEPEPEPLPQEPLAEPEVQVTENPAPQPEQSVEEARAVASRSGLLALQEQLSQMRTPEPSDQQRLIANVENATASTQETTEPVSPEQLQGSGGVVSEQGPQRDVVLARHETRQVEAPQQRTDTIAAPVAEAGPSQRGMTNIRQVFDNQKTALYSLYRRALRQDPALEGKVLLELVIEPDGRVSHCEIVSSELNNPVLESRLASRVLMFDFGAADVARRTVRFPIDFLPS